MDILKSCLAIETGCDVNVGRSGRSANSRKRVEQYFWVSFEI
jgi:hypothetical protein